MVTNSFNPKVSIIIPVYNGSNYLSDAIDSAIAQTYKNIEIIVINDGSTDNGATEDIAKSYGEKIKYFKKKNGGVATALNLGIKKMTGEYFSWLSHDDMYYPNKIADQISVIDSCDTNVAIISDWTIVDSSGRETNQIAVDDRLEEFPMCFLAFDRTTWLNFCAVLIPRDVFNDVGHFNELMPTTQDYDMLHRLITKGLRFKIVHKPLLKSRSHSEQGSVHSIKTIRESDYIHYKIMKCVSDDEIKRYYNDRYFELVDVYVSFCSNGYIKSPRHLIDRMYQIFTSGTYNKKLKRRVFCMLITSRLPFNISSRYRIKLKLKYLLKSLDSFYSKLIICLSL